MVVPAEGQASIWPSAAIGLAILYKGGKGGVMYKDRAPDDNRDIFSVTRR